MAYDVASLHRLFDYDVWANRQWMGAIANFKDQERVAEVLRHIVLAQRSWLSRLRRQHEAGVTIDMMETVPLDVAFSSSASEWKAYLASNDLSSVLRYTRDDGVEYEIPLGEVAHHVLNHGTYHRGHLRGLAEAEGLEAFDDTDYSIFARTPGPGDQR